MDLQDVLQIHSIQIELFGGEASIRDIGLLQSAIAQPQMSFGSQFVHKDIYEMASAYLFHISSNHPFVDGNKRTALACCLHFLEMNDIVKEYDPDELFQMTMKVAEGNSNKEEIANFFKKY